MHGNLITTECYDHTNNYTNNHTDNGTDNYIDRDLSNNCEGGVSHVICNWFANGLCMYAILFH